MSQFAERCGRLGGLIAFIGLFHGFLGHFYQLLRTNVDLLWYNLQTNIEGGVDPSLKFRTGCQYEMCTGIPRHIVLASPKNI